MKFYQNYFVLSFYSYCEEPFDLFELEFDDDILIINTIKQFIVIVYYLIKLYVVYYFGFSSIYLLLLF
jgi:hypothetical protein